MNLKMKKNKLVKKNLSTISVDYLFLEGVCLNFQVISWGSLLKIRVGKGLRQRMSELTGGN